MDVKILWGIMLQRADRITLVLWRRIDTYNESLKDGLCHILLWLQEQNVGCLGNNKKTNLTELESNGYLLYNFVCVND